MRYGIALEHGGWVVRDSITGDLVTHPATSQEAQDAVKEWNAWCVTRPVEPPIRVDGWGPLGELTVWLQAADGWWGLVRSKGGVRWVRGRGFAQVRGLGVAASVRLTEGILTMAL
jgi:hypothetical protein